jgi:hypothetical protein
MMQVQPEPVGLEPEDRRRRLQRKQHGQRNRLHRHSVATAAALPRLAIKPGTKDNRPVAAPVELHMTFTLK